MAGQSAMLWNGKLVFTISQGSSGGAPTPTFDDEFNTLNVANSALGTSGNWSTDYYYEEGDAYWIDPNNPATPGLSNIVSVSNGVLNIGLMNTPPSMLGAVNNLPQVGVFMNAYNGGLHFTQLFGYFEITVAVDRLPGFAFDTPFLSLTEWPPSIDLTRIYTTDDGVQHVEMIVNGVDRDIYSTDSTSGFDPSVMHAYGCDWNANTITFYIDRKPVAQFLNPGGGYQTDPAYFKMFTASHFPTSSTPPISNAGVLPVYAHVDSYKVWSSIPF